MATESVLPTSIEQLPTEIFLQIFGFFHLRELIRTFFGLNSHIDSILQVVRSASHTVQDNDSDALRLLQLFSKQIARLIIIKTDIVDFTSLSNLRSLTLKYTTDAQLKSVRSQYFPLLEILHIYVWPQTLSSANTIEVDDLFQTILTNQFPHLWLCTVLGVAPLTASTTWSLSPSIRFLYVQMKSTKDYEEVLYLCPNLRWFPNSENKLIDFIYEIRAISNNSRKQRIWESINGLTQLESEGKFILEVNPFIVLESKKRRSHSSDTTEVIYVPEQDTRSIYGRIFPQAEPYFHASFLIEIKFPQEYPFKIPEITFLDPICHPHIKANGKISFHWRRNLSVRWHPKALVVDIIRKVINFDTPELPITSSADDNLPKDAAQQLLSYLDILYPNGVSINTVTNTVRNSSPNYKDEVNEFFRTVNIYATDYDFDVVPTYQMTANADKIAKATWTEIKQMLTCLTSGERLSYYSNAYAIESGRIKWILLRLKELVEQ